MTQTNVYVGKKEGTVELTYNMFFVPDEIEVFYEGKSMYWSGGLVSGTHTTNISYGPGGSAFLLVVISAPQSGTNWEFEMMCPVSKIPSFSP